MLCYNTHSWGQKYTFATKSFDDFEGKFSRLCSDRFRTCFNPADRTQTASFHPVTIAKFMHVLISGAGSGIGQAIAQTLSAQGHTCYLLGRQKLTLEQTLAALHPGDHKVFIADIRQPESLEAVVAAHPDLALDAIIANAGMGGKNHFGAGDRWQAIIDTNLTGTYHTVQHFLPALQRGKNPYRHILITSSVLARLGVAHYTAYCASKAGLLGLMRSWAVALAPEKILVNAICPGWVDTDMAHEGLQGIADAIGVSKAAFFDIAMQSVPLRKMSTPDEIAALVSYLVQQQSITGQTIDINGGSVMNS
jgi:NAD(P)-dependent dehydrogenase (short-subunit alcohol dehydrogenase family)